MAAWRLNILLGRCAATGGSYSRGRGQPGRGLDGRVVVI